MITKERRESAVQAERVIAALDVEPVDPEDAQAAVAGLGIDTVRLAGRLKQMVDDHDAADRKARFALAARAHAADLAALRSLRPEPLRPKKEQIAVLRGYLAKLGPDQVSLHFMKFEEATEEDLARLVALARHLTERAGK